MSATEVIIQFVGLCLFSAAVPNDPGVHAILPKITAPHIHQQQSVQVTQKDIQTLPNPTLTQAVEQHVAMLVFPADIVEDESRWKTGPVPNAGGNLTGYKQIQLDGEHVTFHVDGVNRAAAVPSNMPRFRCPVTAGIAPPALTPGYQFPYNDAAAVIDIPDGELSTCKSRGGLRVDTKLKLQTSGRLTIVGMKAGVARSLVLRTDAHPRIYVLNVPDQTMAKSKLAVTGTADHYLAYYAMVGKGPNNSCDGAPRTPEGETIYECAYTDPALARILYSVAGLMSDGLELVGGKDDEESIRISNTECSNSAWP